MYQPVPKLILIVTAMMLISADVSRSPEQCLRNGNRAFAQRKYEEALKWFELAEARTTKPGLVAYNKAITLYHLGQYRPAELHFRRSLEDAKNQRRSSALMGLGNSLLMQASEADVEIIQSAVTAFRLCRDENETNDPVRTKAAHNLELARLLLIEAKKKAAENPQGEPPNKNGGNTRNTKRNGQNGQGEDSVGQNNSTDINSDKGDPVTAKRNSNNVDPNKTVPVRGHPPVIPDEDELVPLPKADTTSYLQQIAERIMQQRREFQKRGGAAARGVKDW